MNSNTDPKRATLPESWRTDDDPTRAAHELHRIVGPESAFILYGKKWWVVRYLDPHDKYGRNHLGEMRERHPWQRRLEILAGGRTLAECCWHLRGGSVRAMIGAGYKPVLGSDGEWASIVGPDGVQWGGTIIGGGA